MKMIKKISLVSLFTFFLLSNSQAKISALDDFLRLKNPSFVNNGITSALIGLSCDPSGLKCLSVGIYNDIPLLHRSNDGGNSWSPPTQLSPTANTVRSILLGASCDMQPTNCLIVGTARFTDYTIPISYTSGDGGATWSTVVTLPIDIPDNVMMDVVCDINNQQCVGIGHTVNNTIHKPLVYTSANGGVSWSNPIYPVLPENALSSAILDLACDSTNLKCLAVGFANAGGILYPVSYNSNDSGSSWNQGTYLNAPQQSINNTLIGVDCDGQRLNCLAVGFSIGANGYSGIAYTSKDGGDSWSTFIIPTPPNNTSASSLMDVQCDNSGLVCITVGIYVLGDGVKRPVVYKTTDGGTTWSSPVTLTLPAGEPLTTILFTLRCDDNMQNCVAVGTTGSNNDTVAVNYTSTDGGTTWSNPIFPPIA